MPWSQQYSHLLPDRFLERTEPILGVAFDSIREKTMMLWGTSYVCTVDFSKPMPSKNESLTQSKKPMALEMDHRFQSIMHMQGLGTELVVVERPVLHVLASLPSAFQKHKYGT